MSANTKRKNKPIDTQKLEGQITIKQTLLLMAAPTLALIFTTVIFGPLELFISNINFFDFAFADLMRSILPVGLVLFICLTIILLLVDKLQFLDVGVSSVFGMTLSCYIQGNFLNLDLGTLDGTSIPWHMYTTHTLINLCIWLVIFLIPFVLLHFSKKLWKYSVIMVSLLIFAMQFVAAVVVLPSALSKEVKQAYYLSNKEQFNLSSKDNIIVFELDSFSANVFKKVLTDYPDAEESFNDFIWFENCSNEVRGTFYGTAYNLTGHRYKPDESYIKYFQDAWRSDSATTFYESLHNVGYKCYAYINSGQVTKQNKDLVNYFENMIYSASNSVDNMLLAKKMCLLSAYRYVPHGFKSTFWMTTYDFSDVLISEKYSIDDVLFYKTLVEDRLQINSNVGQYTFYHLRGAHGPFDMNEFANFQEGVDRYQQARGALFIIEEYIRQMKELGIYENANIVITADHGTSSYPPPIMLIKRNEQSLDKMQIVQAPVSQEDFLPTILDLASLPYERLGQSIFDVNENEIRERSTFSWRFDEAYPDIGTKYNVLWEHTFTSHVRDVDYRETPTAIHPLVDSYYR